MDIKELVGNGFRFKKNLGQNFIGDVNLLKAIVNDAGADEDDTVITDPEELLGDDYEDHFGENDDPDTCYFRNHKLKAEYEVIKDERTFKEVIG